MFDILGAETAGVPWNCSQMHLTKFTCYVQARIVGLSGGCTSRPVLQAENMSVNTEPYYSHLHQESIQYFGIPIPLVSATPKLKHARTEIFLVNSFYVIYCAPVFFLKPPYKIFHKSPI